MNFKEAYQKMLEGKKVKRPDWKGYWFIENDKIKIYLKDGNIKLNNFTQETIINTLADDWEIVGETKSKVWKPKKGDKYFFISSRLEVVKFNNQEDSVDKKVINSGNYFKTKEEAQHMVEKLKVIKELQDFAIENRDEEISWDEDSCYKFSIYFDYKWKMIRISWATVAHDSPFNIYFASEKAIHDAIDSIGEDRIKKYYFDVKD